MTTVGDVWFGESYRTNPYICLCGAYREDKCECGQWKQQRERKEKEEKK